MAIVILETVMIICFGLSWPLSIIKAYKSRTAKGTSIMFMSFVELGYIAGIIAKIIAGSWDWIHILSFSFYILNLLMVATGMVLYFRNRGLDKKRAAEKAASENNESLASAA